METLKNLSEELNCSYKELFIMILPCKEDFSMKFYVYQITPSERKYISDGVIPSRNERETNPRALIFSEL